MAIDSDNDSTQSSQEEAMQIDSRLGGSINELTVRLPGAKPDSRSSKPVKLKRKSYDLVKQKQEKVARRDEKVTYF